MTPDEFHRLREPAILAALREHEATPADAFALRFGGHPSWPVRAMAEQIQCRHRAWNKLPAWRGSDVLFTPLALEQCSSLAAAAAKSRLVAKAHSLIDCTAGLGVDLFTVGAGCAERAACERDPLLRELLAHNATALGLSLPAIHDDCLSALPGLQAELCLVDPDRRGGAQRRIDLRDAQPPVAKLARRVRAAAAISLWKLAPAQELDVVARLLPDLAELQVVSVAGECKEVLALCRHGERYAGPVALCAVVLDAEGQELFRLSADGERCPPSQGPVADCFAEPDPAIIRAGLVAELAAQHGLHQLHPAVAYLSGPPPASTFPGRVWRVLAEGRFRERELRRLLAERGIVRANVGRRHFPWDPPTIQRKLGLKGGGQHHICCWRDVDGEMHYMLGEQ